MELVLLVSIVLAFELSILAVLLIEPNPPPIAAIDDSNGIPSITGFIRLLRPVMLLTNSDASIASLFWLKVLSDGDSGFKVQT